MKERRREGTDRNGEQTLVLWEFAWCIILVAVKDRYGALEAVTWCRHRRGYAGRIDELSVRRIQEMLAFLLVTWSLLLMVESLSICNSIPGSSRVQIWFHHRPACLASFSQVEWCCLSFGGFPKGTFLVVERRMVVSVWLPWSRVGSKKEKVFQVETSSLTLALLCEASWFSIHRCRNLWKGSWMKWNDNLW